MPESEQFLSLAIATRSRSCPDLQAFLLACEKADVPHRPLDSNWHRWQQMAAHLKEFANLELPPQEYMRETWIISGDWNDVELVLAFDAVFVWYHWSTSA